MMKRVEGAVQRWQAYQPSKTQTFWFAALAVAATLIVGFSGAGWVSASTAQQRVTEATQAARHELAAAICVEEFMARVDAQARLAKLKTADYWSRSELVADGGWATMPDRKEPNRVVAMMCAARLSEVAS
jgi:hypothetical protein